jgi:chromosome partitioning protein
LAQAKFFIMSPNQVGNMITLAISSQKGGVGKTTVSLNLAAALSQKGQRVLLVDADTQGSLGKALVSAEDESKTLYALLNQGGSLRDACLNTRLDTLRILRHGNINARDYASWLQKGQEASLWRNLIDQARQDSVDWLILDTAAGLHGLTLGALRAADFALIPQQAEPMASHSLALFLDLLGASTQEDSHCRICGLVITMLDFTNPESLQVAQELRNSLPGEFLCQTVVPRDSQYIKASRHGLPVNLLGAEAQQAASVFNQLASELEFRVGYNPQTTDDRSASPLPLFV